jgi:hypothetical protein
MEEDDFGLIKIQQSTERTEWKKHPHDKRIPRKQAIQSSPHRPRSEYHTSRSVSRFANKQRGVMRIKDRYTHHAKRNTIRSELAHGEIDTRQDIPQIKLFRLTRQ